MNWISLNALLAIYLLINKDTINSGWSVREESGCFFTVILLNIEYSFEGLVDICLDAFPVRSTTGVLKSNDLSLLDIG